MQHTKFIIDVLSNAMKAKFASSCISCGDKIQLGKEIAKNKDDKWVHKHCVDDVEGLP
ncbi:MAG TPA: hypothetical protein VIH04_00080 [Nitrosarchaeum sp.]